MGLFDKIKDAASKQRQTPVPSPDPDQVLFTRTYVNSNRFKGFRRLHVTVYGDRYGANENALRLLGDKEIHGCVGSTVTLSGFDMAEYQGGTGMRVAVDGIHIGIVYEQSSTSHHEYYEAAYSGDIEDVYVRIERLTEPGEPDRADVALFVKLAE